MKFELITEIMNNNKRGEQELQDDALSRSNYSLALTPIYTYFNVSIVCP